MSKPLIENVSIITGAITTATALVLAIGNFFEAFKPLYTWFEKLGDHGFFLFWAGAAVLLLLGLILLFRGLARKKSRLLRPQKLRIDPDNPDHLQGREEEIKRLLQAVANRPLVFLEGESGSGKSALVRSGLIPAIEKADPPTLLPVYLDTYTGDWDTGLAGQLAQTLWHALGGAGRERLGIATLDGLRGRLLPGGEEAGVFGRIHNELGLIPLLIFDQFDDYQISHRGRFLREGRWIGAEELAAENNLWRGIRAEIKRGAIHCLFVTRRDMAAGLEAARLADALPPYTLDRLKPVFITGLLERLVAPGADDLPVIERPENGWESLKERLIRDLTRQGLILPIQARIVFSGLTDLTYLTTGAYERKGGIEGLEAAYVQSAVYSAASATGIAEARVLEALLELVDETDPERPKSRMAGEGVLVEAADADATRGRRMLEVLGEKGVIHRRAGEAYGDDRGNGRRDNRNRWSLYHDYLARAVLAAHRRANYWQRLLEERRRAFRDAADWRARWRALLSPWEQLKLIRVTTLRGRVRWGGYGGFWLWSGLRVLVPVLALAVPSLIGVELYRVQQAWQAAGLMLSGIQASIDKDMPNAQTHEQLWALATTGPRGKRAFLRRAMAEAKFHPALLEHPGSVYRALFGLDPERELRRWALEQLVAAAKTPGADSPTVRFLAEFSTRLIRSAPNAFQDGIPQVASGLVAAMEKTKDSWGLRRLGQMLAGLSEKLSAGAAAKAASRLLAAMDKTGDARELSALGRALAGLGENLSAEAAEKVVSLLVAAMEKTGDARELSELGQMLAGLSERLSAEAAEKAASLLLATMEKTKDSWELRQLGQALAGLGENLTAGATEKAASRLVAAMEKTGDSGELRRLGEALAGLGEKLSAEAAAKAASRLLVAMEKTGNAWELRQLGEALAGLGERLSAGAAEKVVSLLLAAMEKTGDVGKLYYLGQALAGLGERLPTEAVEKAASLLLAAMEKTGDNDELSELGQALARLGEKLSAKAAEKAASLLVAAMEKTGDSWELRQLGQALAGLGERLSAGAAEKVVSLLLAAMEKTGDVGKLYYLGQALAGLGERLPTEAVEKAASLLLAAMEKTGDGRELSELGQALAGLGEKLSARVAEKVTSLLVAAMEKTGNAWELRELGEALAGLGEKLSAEAAKKLAFRLLAAMGNTRDANEFLVLAKGLGALPLPQDRQGLDTAPDLLQAPMAFDGEHESEKTLTHLLHYYRRLANPKKGEEFTTLDGFVAWAKEHRPGLDLARRPCNPWRGRCASMP